MRALLAAAAAVGLLGAAPQPSPPKSMVLAQYHPHASRGAPITCFKTGEEQIPGQMTKICYYDCLGSRTAITIGATQLCPLSIKR